MTTQNQRARWMRRLVAAPVAAAITLGGPPARAAEQTIDLTSRGGYQSARLPDGTTEVELVQQTAGGCRFGRTWGFDLTNKEVWVDGGCGGRFKITVSGAGNSSGGDSNTSSSDNSSNIGAAVAAAAVIAGIALIASSKDKDKDRDRDDDWQGDAGWNSRQIRGKGGLCLDIEGGARPGRNLIVYDCNGGGNQRFEWNRNGELRVSGLCLDVADRNTSDGARVMAFNCNGGSNQRWRTRGGEIRSVETGKCLDIENGRARPGTAVIMYRCNGGDNQRWSW
ncbi:lectin [Mitsuaria sp. GD03876]|uniref:lectin n=1 Tax=Mitsuaria sp. GD03876 TaxID=2975399 RepID=UPI00244A4AED|nr:lectin [Mitsuaria sp. GD03876]MDH0864900.1 lectin [Mitsuaria sp. GD03876]